MPRGRGRTSVLRAGSRRLCPAALAAEAVQRLRDDHRVLRLANMSLSFVFLKLSQSCTTIAIRRRRTQDEGDRAQLSSLVSSRENDVFPSHERSDEDTNGQEEEIARGKPAKPSKVRAPERRAVASEAKDGLEPFDDVVAVGGRTCAAQHTCLAAEPRATGAGTGRGAGAGTGAGTGGR